MKTDRDLTLDQVVCILKDSWKILLIAPLLACVLTYILVGQKAPKWDGRVTVQVGQIGAGNPVESLPLSVIRFQSYFQSLDMSGADGIKLSVKPFDEKLNLLEVSARANNRDAVKKGLEQAVEYIANAHASLSSEDLSVYKETLKQKKADMVFINKEIFNLMLMLKDRKSTDSASVLSTLVLSNLRSEKILTEKVIFELDTKLSHQNTFSTHKVGEIEVPSAPSSPRKRMAVLLVFFISMSATAFFVLVRGLIKK